MIYNLSVHFAQVCYLKQCVNFDISELPHINSRKKHIIKNLLKFALAAGGLSEAAFCCRHMNSVSCRSQTE